MKEKSKKYSDLIVWQKSHSLALEVYRISKQFPKEEIFGLTSQLRRASISVPANIAEGFARKGIKDKLRFYNIAEASLSEVSYFLLLSQELGYAETSYLIDKVDEIGRMLNSYSKSLSDTDKHVNINYLKILTTNY
jgi:four helix bundle protein